MPRPWRAEDVDTIFRRAHRFIDGNEPDAIGAFPVLMYKSDNTFDLIFVKNNAGIIDTFSGIGQSGFAMKYLHQRFGGKEFTHKEQQFVTGFPIHEFHELNAAALLLRPEAVEVRHISKGDIVELPIAGATDMIGSFQQIDKYAVKNQFAGGFLDCHDHNGYHRIFLFKKEYFVRKSIPEWRLNHLTTFLYDYLSTPDFQAPLRKAHNIICSIIDGNSCDNVLTEYDKGALKAIYENQFIQHHEAPLQNPTWDAQAKIHGRGIWFRPNYISTSTPYALTRLVFHEMMHNIGYDHPAPPGSPAYLDSKPERVKRCVPTYFALEGESLDPEFNCGVIR